MPRMTLLVFTGVTATLEVTGDLGTVPAGERLVVEQLSVEMEGSSSDSSTQRMRVALATTAGGVAARYTFVGADGGAHPDFPSASVCGERFAFGYLVNVP